MVRALELSPLAGEGLGRGGRWPMRLPRIAPHPPFGHLLPAGGEKESAGVIHDADDAEKRREAQDDTGFEPLSPRGRGVGERGRWPMRLPHIAPHPPFGHLLPAGGEKESAGSPTTRMMERKGARPRTTRASSPSALAGERLGRGAGGPCACRASPLIRPSGTFSPLAGRRKARGHSRRG